MLAIATTHLHGGMFQTNTATNRIAMQYHRNNTTFYVLNCFKPLVM